MTTYYFHIVYGNVAVLDEVNVRFATPYKAIKEAELNLLTLALEARVKGTPAPLEIAVVKHGRHHEFVSLVKIGAETSTTPDASTDVWADV